MINALSRSTATPDATLAADVRRAIQDVPDFPSAGIVFKDVTPIFLDRDLFARVVRAMGQALAATAPTHVAAIESRGFIIGAPLALELGLPFVPIRKQGKLPRAVERVSYALEYGSGVLEVHSDAIAPGSRVLIVDDVLATGGTALAAAQLVAATGGQVVGFSFLASLSFLPGLDRLAGERVASVVTY
ncbi:MAG TPA: adenine phosphoribosyltransferase [Gaiellaceae bacterium]|nr:adenine phosphoribosyltransferase [Gaiellaceae bacterium]